jgi:hypothetical protein
VRALVDDGDRLGWAALGAAAGTAAIGRVAGAPLLFGVAAASLAVLLVVVVPEVLIAVFLAAGTIKANPLLAAFPGDLTIAGAGAVAVAMVVRMARLGVPPVPRAAAAYPLLAAFMALSVLWSPDPETGLSKVATFETLTLLAFVSPFVLIRSRAQLQRLMVALVAIGLFVALTAVEGPNTQAPLIAAGGNEIELALYCAWGMLAAVGYLLIAGRSPLRLLWLAPAVLLGLTMVQAGSRGVLAGAGLALAFLTVQMALFRMPGRPMFLAVVGSGAIAVVLAGAQVAGGATEKYTNYLFGANVQSILIGRQWILGQGLRLSIDHPLGLGAGGFQWSTGWTYSHNMFFELSSELGMLSVALVVALIVAAWRARLRGPGARSRESAICGALLLLFLVQALITNGPNDARPLWFTLGLCLALPALRASAPRRSPASPPAG